MPRSPFRPALSRVRHATGALTKAAAALLLAGCLALCCSDAPAGTSAPDAFSAATLTAARTPNPSADSRPVLTVALLDTLINPYDTFYLRQTIRHLEEALPAYRWRTISLSAAEAETDIAAAKPDFLFAPAGFSASAALTQSPAAFRIATRRAKRAEHAEGSVGAVFAVRASSGLQTLRDLRGKHAGSGIPIAVDGWLAAAGELADAGFDPEDFFSSVDFRNNAYPDVISSLLAGKIDVAILPTCLLETLEAARLIDASGLQIVNAKANGLACTHSTALYPDVSFLALGTAPEAAVRDATIAILSQKAPSAEFEWLTNVPLTSVQALFRQLKCGPYAYLRDMSPKAIFLRWKTEIGIAALLIGFLIVNEFRLRILVRRRTQELRRSLRERRRMAEEAEAVRQTLAGFERRSIVQQMSGMIAHEVNAPIGAIRTYAAVLKMAAPSGAAGLQGPAAQALDGIEREAVRISDIVKRVRSYAKREADAHVQCSLSEIISRSLTALHAELPPGSPVRTAWTAPAEPAYVFGDPLELELLFLNLLRNAARAAAEADKSSMPMRRRKSTPNVRVGLKVLDGRCRASVENIGSASPEAISRLNSAAAGILRNDALHHKDSQGLGLGLSICRGIADNHCASLVFEAGGLGIRAVFTIDETAESALSSPDSQKSSTPAKER